MLWFIFVAWCVEDVCENTDGSFFPVVKMRLHSVSYVPPAAKVLSDISLDVARLYPKLTDSDATTCEIIAGMECTNIVWLLPSNKTSDQFRVFINGTQQCRDVNTAWFMSGRELGSSVIECDVTQEQPENIHICNIRCLCPCGVKCDYLHLQLQFPPWMMKSLSICYYEHVNSRNDHGTIISALTLGWNGTNGGILMRASCVSEYPIDHSMYNSFLEVTCKC